MLMQNVIVMQNVILEDWGIEMNKSRSLVLLEAQIAYDLNPCKETFQALQLAEDIYNEAFEEFEGD